MSVTLEVDFEDIYDFKTFIFVVLFYCSRIAFSVCNSFNLDWWLAGILLDNL